MDEPRSQSLPENLGLADHRMHGRIWRIRYVGKALEKKPTYSKASDKGTCSGLRRGENG